MRRLFCILLMSAMVFAVSAAAVTAAQAAPAPAPAWKLLAATGPTNLSPRQSEVQRLTVKAEGGTFSLTLPDSGSGEGTLEVVEGFAEATEGSNQVHVWAPFGSFEVGEMVTAGPIPADTTILAISGPSSEPTLELSNSATGTNSFIEVKAASDEVTGVTINSGVFQVGNGIEGSGIQSGTTIVSVSGSTIKLSKYPTSGGTVALSASEQTSPIEYDADARQVEGALQALAGLGPGSVVVEGGPGGDGEHPYVLEFGGSLEDRDVNELSADAGHLEGANAFAQVFTTQPGGAGTGQITVSPTNVGGLATSGEYTLTVGPLPEGIVTSGPALAEGWSCPGGAGQRIITCTDTEPVAADSLISEVSRLSIPIEVQSNAAPSSSATVEISGGGATKPATFQMPIVVSNQQAPPGVQALWAGAFEADGTLSTQAGAHPYAAMTYFRLNTVRSTSGEIVPAGQARDAIVDLPPGFIGDPLATERCPQSNVICGTGTGAGTDPEASFGLLAPILVEFAGAGGPRNQLSNDVPPRGYAAEFSTVLAIPIVSLLGSVNSETDYGIRITSPNIPTIFKVFGSFVQLEGVPAHGNGQALLTNPVDCAEAAEQPPLVTGKFDTWQDPGSFSESITVAQPALTGCDKLKFEAKNPSTGEGQVSFGFQPTSTQGSSPVGATAHLHIDQGGLTDPDKLVTPELKRAVVKLPAGLSLNPSAANGLESCSEAQIGYLGKSFPMPTPIRFNEAQPACPDGSKLGTAEIKTPLLEDPLVGTVYLASQEENPFGSLLAIYFVVNDPLTGVLVKVPGEIQANPVTGQLTATFDDTPQLPFEDLILNFRGGGPRSEFATSEVCGNYSTEGEWTPWSAPESGPPAMTSDSFSVAGGCSSSLAARPFSPSFQAGIASTQAGGYGPLVINVGRKDGEQELSSLDFTLPAGVIGKLAGIPQCSDAAIAQAAGKTGRQEQANPSCPSGSLLGSVDAAAGVGSEPVHVAGRVYLAGPYEGAPISSVAVIPAVAGPFDLGDVVVRAPIYINPETAVLTVKTDAIPTILRGIPLKVQTVALNINRPDFTLNPTNCDAKTASAAITGNSGATAAPTVRFQVGGCAGLAFKPKLGVATSGKTSKANGASLHVTLVPPHQGPDPSTLAEEANISRVKVDLPKQLPSRLTTLQKACTSAQFDANPSGCPAASIVGTAVARTPLLANPLTGPAYFVSRGDEAFPQLVLVLQGENITVQLVGDTFISKAGITSSTFAEVPDVPITSFELTLPEGKYSALAANANLCTQKLAMPTEFAAQNGTVIKQSTPITVEGCSSSISIVSHKLKGRKLTVSVSVPAAGKLKASGKRLSSQSKTAKGRETIKLTLHTTKSGKLTTRLKLTFTPSTGKDRRKQSKTLKVTFKK